MRRLVVIGLALLVLGAAYGRPEGDPLAGDSLFLQTSAGVEVIQPGAASPTYSDPVAVQSSDWSTVVETHLGKKFTTVVAVDPLTQRERWELEVPGNQTVNVVSRDGTLAALSPTWEYNHAVGRRTTRLTVVGSRSIEPKRFVLDGNYEPEAFSTDGKHLFLVSYLPARAPNSYQVRRLDLTTGKVEGVTTPDKHLQQRMGGTARIQTASPDGRRLYTLYTLTMRGETYAFIHVLSLDELWAHCIDLPAEFATKAERATAMTVSPDGRNLFVLNSTEGVVARVDTEDLRVVDTQGVRTGAGSAHLVHDGRSTLYVGSGDQLSAIRTTDGERGRTWMLPEPIRGLQLTTDGARLYVGLRHELHVFDATSGEKIDVLNPSGIAKIVRFGPVMPQIDDGAFVCAC